jgi:hypothetical protein
MLFHFGLYSTSYASSLPYFNYQSLKLTYGLGGAAVRICDGGLPTFVRFSHQRYSGDLNDTSLRHPDDIRDLSIFDTRAREHR